MKTSVPDLASFHAIVRGRVQGVFFRSFVRQHARTLGLTGTVRNVRHSNAVEVKAEGERPQLVTLLQLLHRGPSEARVDDVEIDWKQYNGDFSEFSITYYM